MENVCRTSDVYDVATGCEKRPRLIQRNVTVLHLMPPPVVLAPNTAERFDLRAGREATVL